MAQINKPSEYFNTKLYTGNGKVTQNISVVVVVDIIIIKNRANRVGLGLQFGLNSFPTPQA